MAKFEVIKSEKTDKSYIWIIVLSFVMGIIIILISDSFDLFNNEKDKYLDSKIRECSNITLRQGLENLKDTMYGQLNYSLSKQESKQGEKLMYLTLNDVYTTIKINSNNQVYLGDYMFSADSNAIDSGSSVITALLCGKN